MSSVLRSERQGDVRLGFLEAESQRDFYEIMCRMSGVGKELGVGNQSLAENH